MTWQEEIKVGTKLSIRSLLLALTMLITPMASFAQVGISITITPPELPVYEQPACPGDGYIWTPGNWAWGDDGYYWVPGTWVMAPQVGFLWTPGLEQLCFLPGILGSASWFLRRS
jgi:hypothetical protein